MDNPYRHESRRARGPQAQVGENMEAFAQVPFQFYQHLSPDQFIAMQQLYRTAYEKARADLQGKDPFLDGPDLGFGI